MVDYNVKSVIKIQSYIRRYLSKNKLENALRIKFDELAINNKLQILQNLRLLKLLFQNKNYNIEKDIERYCIILKLILKLTNDVKSDNHQLEQLIIQNNELFLGLCERLFVIGKIYLTNTEFEPKFSTILALYLNYLIFVTNQPSHIEIMEQNLLFEFSYKLISILLSLDVYELFSQILYKKLIIRPSLSKIMEDALLFVILKLIQCMDYSKDILNVFFQNIFITPNFIHYMIKSQYYKLNKSTYDNKFFNFILDEDFVDRYENLDGNRLLIFLSNICNYFSLNPDILNNNRRKFCILIVQFISNMEKYILIDKQQAIHWHSIYGWAVIPSPNHKIISIINLNLKSLWSSSIILATFKVPKSPLFCDTELKLLNPSNEDLFYQLKPCLNKVKHLPNNLVCYKKPYNYKSSITQFLNDDLTLDLIYASTMYEKIMDILVQQKLYILSAFSCKYQLIESLWNYLVIPCDIENTVNMYTYIIKNQFDSLSPKPEIGDSKYEDILNPLKFACDITSHIIILLDDHEIFTEKVLFANPHDMLIKISKFLNLLIYKIICNMSDYNFLGNSPKPDIQKSSKLRSLTKFIEKWNFCEFDNHLNATSSLNVNELFENAFFVSCHTLLKILYERDCKKSFTSKGHWLINEVKIADFFDGTLYDNSNYMLELEMDHLPNNPFGNLIINMGKNLNNNVKESLQVPLIMSKQEILLNKIPHILSQNDRVTLFRKYLSQESVEAKADETVSYIKIRRTSLLEDGYAQINGMSPSDIKGTIRVRFVNPQGLEEPGIDQDGVFKEFLEEIAQKVFNPALNLFKVTTDEKYYPSPTSHLQDNHLGLFEFVGRLVGKAVFEGIVLDGIELAPFFLNQIVQHDASSILKGGGGGGKKVHTGKKSAGQVRLLYSPIDELESMDAELYKNLKYLKRFPESVDDLGLTFAINTDCLGKIETEDLIPGGRAIPVTSENHFSYIHLMARHKMHVQIHKQLSAFLRGFYAIIKPEPISIFSGREFQQIISGDTREIDLNELRKHTRYYGGFFDKHRVVVWLWDILAKDFDAIDRAKFLKFVTSCSRPPLQGFSRLEPPFSIRCVEVGDELDTGDTLATVIQGFFSLRRSSTKDKKTPRLPTASTCFNLLKLPNYSKRSILKDKLKYAINSNTGFELS